MEDRKICGNCFNNEDGLCDMLGLFVDDDNEPICKGLFLDKDDFFNTGKHEFLIKKLKDR